MIEYNTTVVALGATLLGANAGVVGALSVLRGRALVGDAIAHAALPGLCIAFMLRGERNLPTMLLGAFASGIAGVAVIAALRQTGRIKEDAAIGIVLSVFFGAGMALSRIVQNQTSQGSKAGLDSFIFGKTAGMIEADVYWILRVSIACVLVICLLYKEFQAISFDLGFAKVQGWPVYWLDLLTMLLLAATVVIGLPAVGVVMIAALLILPAASARFWTKSLATMLLLSGTLGAGIGLTGTLLSAYFPSARGLPAGPIIVLAGTAVFAASVLLAPRRGVLARRRERRAVNQELARQQFLARIHDLYEAAPGNPIDLAKLSVGHRWSDRQIELWVQKAHADGLLQAANGQLHLTSVGVTAASVAATGKFSF